MSDLEKPILYVQASQQDYTAKQGGGGTPDPIVPVTPALRAQLTEQLDAVAQVANESAAIPAMIIKLRVDALAKSNRPNQLFDRVGIPVSAARRIGELVVPADPQGLRNLREVIAEAATKMARFQISTIESLAIWTSADVLESGDGQLTAAELGTAIRDHRRFRLEFFPWAGQDFGPLQAEGLGQLHIEHAAGTTARRVIYFRAENTEQVMGAAAVPGVRQIGIEPEYAAPQNYAPQMYLRVGGDMPADLHDLPESLPTLGILDSGVNSALLAPYVVDRIQYELAGDTDYMHGTFVGGLAAAGKVLNAHCAGFPSDRSKLLDAVVLPTGSIGEADLIHRIRDAVSRHPEVKVWNCSFGSAVANDPPQFGTFARELDRMSDEHGVLFVVAAGNYSSQFARGWPAEAGHFPGDRVAMPSEAVRALTVGALAPFACAVPAGSPASYSRRGPGPAFTCKPEVVHFGGGVDIDGAVQGGVRSILPGDEMHEGVGTSFSTPIISTIAANAWATLAASGRDVDPTLVKALMVHASALNSPTYSAEDRNYYGFGMPSSSVDSMFCDPEAFTLLFAVDLERGVDWDKTPFPIPACLVTDTGALRAEIVMTLCYASPVADEFGDEYVQHEVDASFGSYDIDPADDTKRKHHGLVPIERPVGADTREVALLTEALKYSPTKVYRARFPRGRSAEQWRVKLSLTQRKEVVDNVVQRAYLLVTLRGLEPDLPVYVDGLRAMPANWISNELVNRVTVRQRLR